MRFKEKVLIFVAAIVLTFLGFSLIGSSSTCMLKIGKEAGYEIIENYLAETCLDPRYS